MGEFAFSNEARSVYLSAPFIVVADIETTGFSGKYDDIIEIGAVLLDVEKRALATREDGKPMRFSAYVRPQNHKAIPAKITELTGITNETVQEKGVSRNAAVEGFYQFIKDYPVAFHNAAFDWGRFLQRDMLAIGRRPTNPIVCTVELAKYLYPDRKRYNLAEMCEFLGKPIEGHHRAWVDCTYTASVLLHMRDELLGRGEAVESEQLRMEKPAREATSLTVHRVQRWKKGQYDRIYVQTSIGSIFYDLKKGNWAFKDLRNGVQMGIESCVQEILSQIGIKEEELAEKFPAA